MTFQIMAFFAAAKTAAEGKFTTFTYMQYFLLTVSSSVLTTCM